MTASVAIVATGTANLASIFAAIRRSGHEPSLARGPEEVSAAERVVLPGVGSFGAAMGEIDRTGMTESLERRLGDGRPTLAVCVGMQLLGKASAESPGAGGLGVFDRNVGRFPATVRVPQMGWNRVRCDPRSRYLTDGWAYFANSYRIDELPDGWVGAWADHGGEFVAGMERGEVLACQFHPELSGSWGRDLIARWLEGRGA